MKRALFYGFFISVLLGATSRAHAGARIFFDLDQGTAILRAEMRYFGDIRPEVLEKTTRVIERQWSGLPTREGDTDFAPLYLTFKKRLKISAEIKTIYLSSIDEAKEQATQNRDVWINFVRVEQSYPTQKSSLMSLSGNLGIFLYDDDIGESTTAAHEFGHALGLGHIESSTAWEGNPPMMLQAGALSNEPQYSLDPSDPTASVNPIYRRVRQEELDLIRLDQAKENDEMALAKVVYESGSRTRGYIDLGYWVEVNEKQPYFKERLR